MKKNIKYIIYSILILTPLIFLINIGNSTSTEIGVLIEYKDSFLKNNSSLINSLANIISSDDNKNINLLDNRNSDVVLNPNNNIIINNNKSFINGFNSYYQINQNAPKNPTIYAPINGLGNKVKINYGVPLFFISYFQDGNSTQEGGYTIFRIVDKTTGNTINRMFLGQAKITDTYQKPAKNKTYTYGFYQTQNISNLFLPGGNLNLSPTGITSLNTNINLPVGRYDVYIQNINKFGIKSDEVKGGEIEIINSPTTLGTVTSVGTPGNYKTDLSQLNFTTINGLEILGKKGSATNIEYINNTINNSIYNVNITGDDFKISNLKLLEGVNSIIINFKDDSNKIINSVPLLISIDSLAPSIYNFKINEEDFKYENDGKTYKLDFYQKEKNIVTYKNIININDNLSSNKTDNLEDKIPLYFEYNDLNVNGIKFYYGFVNQYTSLTNEVTPIASGSINGRKYIKFNIPEEKYVDKNKRLYLYGEDKYGNKSQIIGLDYFLNRFVNKPRIITNNGNDFLVKTDKIDLTIGLDNDVNKLIINGKEYIIPYSNSITLYGLSLLEGENIFKLKAIDLMGNSSEDTIIKIIRTKISNNGLEGSDKQLKINGSINAGEINFNRITPNGSPGEIIQGN